MLNLVSFARVLFIFKLSSGLFVLVVKLLCSVTTYTGINKNNNNNFKFRPFLLRYTITIQWLSVVHGLHSLFCIAKINTRDLSAMKDTLRKDRETYIGLTVFSNKSICISKGSDNFLIFFISENTALLACSAMCFWRRQMHHLTEIYTKIFVFVYNFYIGSF